DRSGRPAGARMAWRQSSRSRRRGTAGRAGAVGWRDAPSNRIAHGRASHAVTPPGDWQMPLPKMPTRPATILNVPADAPAARPRRTATARSETSAKATANNDDFEQQPELGGMPT